MGVLSGRHRRNSFDALRECFSSGVYRLEVDVHSLAGPDYIVFHDRRLEHMTNGRGSIGQATPEQVRAIEFTEHPGDRPPLLSEIVELMRDCDTEIQLDLKDWRPMPPERLRALTDTIAPVKDRVIISSGQDWNLARLHQSDPEIRFGFDPGHYIDHAIEGDSVFLPRTMGAYGYRDDHPLAFGRTEATCDYLEQRMAMLMLQTPGASEYFLSYRLVCQMLDDGFNVAEWLHERDMGANVWTPDHHGEESVRMLERLIALGIDRVTTNTAPAWLDAFAGREQTGAAAAG
jgi:glycerophosphoryl diester phosphodiesterase